MAKRIALASTKGGVGKTTSAISLGHALTEFGREIIVVDADVHRPHVGLILGYEYTPQSLHGALEGEHSISEATYLHPSGLRVLPGNITAPHKEYDKEKLFDMLTDFHSTCEALIIDTPPANIKALEDTFRHVDAVIVVTTADESAIKEAEKTIAAAKHVGTKVYGVIITKHKENQNELDPQQVEQRLNTPVIGLIPYNKEVQIAHAHKHPVTYTHTDAPVSVEYKKLAANLIGGKYIANVQEEQPEKLRDTILKKLGFKR